MKWTSHNTVQLFVLLFILFMVVVFCGTVYGFMWLLYHYTTATLCFVGLFITYIYFEDKINPNIRQYKSKYE